MRILPRAANAARRVGATQSTTRLLAVVMLSIAQVACHGARPLGPEDAGSDAGSDGGLQDAGSDAGTDGGTGGDGGVVAAPIATLTAPSIVTNGATGLVAAVPSQLDTTYAWTISGGTITDGAGTNQITFTAGAVGAMQLVCTVRNSAGVSATGSVGVIVTADPVVSISAPTAATTGAAGLTASVPAQAAATYAWTISGGTITSSADANAVTFTAGAVGTLTLYCQVSLGTDSISGSADIAVVAAPVATLSVPEFAAVGQTGLTASVPSADGATYVWSIANGSITSGAGTSAIVFTAGSAGSALITCTVTNAAGTSATSTASFIIIATPGTPIVSAPSTVTTGSSGLSASVALHAGEGCAWTISGGTITSSTHDATVTFSAGAVGTLTISCEITNPVGNATGSASIAVIAAPVAALTAPGIATVGATGLTASVPAQDGSSYAWTITNGTITGGDGTNAITFTAGSIGLLVLDCTVTNAAGTAVSGGASIIVTATPIASIVAPRNVTTNTAGWTASVATQAGASYVWTIVGGTITAGGTGSPSLTFTAGAVGTLTLTCSVTVGSTTTRGTLDVVVVAAPDATLTAPNVGAVGQTGLAASVPSASGVTYLWSVTNGAITSGAGTSAIVFTAGSAGNASIACTVTNAAGTSATSSLLIPVVAPPTSPVLTAPATVTTGSTGLVASVDLQSGATYTWTITGGTITSGAGSPTIQFTAGAIGTLALSCDVRNPVGHQSGSANVSVVAAPVATITTAATVFTGQTSVAASVVAQSGDSYLWTIANGTITSGQGTNAIIYTAGSAGTPLVLGCTVTDPSTGSAAVGSASVEVLVSTASLAVTLTGNPSNATVTMNGPNGYTNVISASETLSGLVPGSYSATAAKTIFNGLAYTPTMSGSPASISAGGSGAIGITYASSNTAPTINQIAAQTIYGGSTSPTRAVTIGDAEDAATTLNLSASSSVAGVLSNITVAGTGTARTVTFTAAPTAAVTSTNITLTVTDSQNAQTAMTFLVNVMPSAIVTSSADSGAGTLRSLVNVVPANTTITFDPALNGQTLALVSTIIVPVKMTIVGPGASNFTIDGGGTVQMFNIKASSTLSGFTFNHGYAAGGGAAIVAGPAATTLTVDSSVFNNNYAAGGAGGAISASGPLTVTNSTFTGNSTALSGGLTGGAISACGVTRLVGDAFTSNASNYGGGAINLGCTGSSLTISGCSFSANSSQIWGGAVYTRSPATVTNSTFAGNSSQSGGAFYAYDSATPPSASFASLSFVTVTTSTDAANYGAVYSQLASISMSNSIVSGNTGGDLGVYSGGGSFSSGGYNLIGSVNGIAYSGGTGDIYGASAGLGTYANHGGTVPTINVSAGGAGVNAIPPAACIDLSGNAVTTDARGSARPGDTNANCDIGSYERQSTDP